MNDYRFNRKLCITRLHSTTARRTKQCGTATSLTALDKFATAQINVKYTVLYSTWGQVVRDEIMRDMTLENHLESSNAKSPTIFHLENMIIAKIIFDISLWRSSLFFSLNKSCYKSKKALFAWFAAVFDLGKKSKRKVKIDIILYFVSTMI